MPYLYLILILLFWSCKGEKKIENNIEKSTATSPKEEVKYVNSIRILSPEKNALLSYNDLIDIEFSVKEKFSVDSIQIFWEGKKLPLKKTVNLIPSGSLQEKRENKLLKSSLSIRIIKKE